MKKILFILLLIPFNVFAINYSPYTDYKYTDNFIKASENCQVDELKKYKYYKLEKDYTSDYFNANYKDDYYIYKDSNYIYSDFITSNELPNQDEINELSEAKYTYYQEYNKIKYVILHNFTYSKSLTIRELILYDNKNMKINYQIIKGDSSLNDSQSFSGGSKVYTGDVIILKLDKELSNTKFSLNFWVAGPYPSTFSLDYNLNASGDPNDIYYYGTLSGGLSSADYYRVEASSINHNESLNSEVKVKSGHLESIKNAKIIKYSTEYTYKEKLYKYYNYKKTYLDDYYLNYDDDNYIKDENDFKFTYRYRCRTILNNVVSDDKIAHDGFLNRVPPTIPDYEIENEILNNDNSSIPETEKEVPAIEESTNEVIKQNTTTTKKNNKSKIIIIKLSKKVNNDSDSNNENNIIIKTNKISTNKKNYTNMYLNTIIYGVLFIFLIYFIPIIKWKILRRNKQ